MALRRLIAVALILGCTWLTQAQDPHFTQYYANPLYLNPAFAGVKQCPRVTTNYRNQYPTLGVYQTFSASYDQYVDGLNGGIGFMIMQDEAANGDLSLTEVSGIYSYHLQVNRDFMVLFGAQATFRQRSLNWNNLTFPDMIDPFFGFVKPTNEIRPDETTVQQIDLSFGMLGFTENFYVGASAHHVTQPNEAFLSTSTLPIKVTAQAGATIPIGRKRLYNDLDNLLIPNIVYQTQGGAHHMTAGVSFNRGPITGGLGYRQALGVVSTNPDALIAIIGIAPNDVPWQFGYSYDYTISALGNVMGGAHEVSLAYQFPCRSRRARSSEVKCPKF